jgi:signal transduction histidine kinase
VTGHLEPAGEPAGEPAARPEATPAGARRAWAARAQAVVPLAACALVGLLFSGQMYLLSPGDGWAGALTRNMPQWLVWGLLVPLILRADRRLGAGRAVWARALLHVPLGVAWTTVALAIRFAVRPVLHGGYPPSVARFMAERFPWDLLIYGAIAGLAVARDYAADARRREREAAQLALRASQLETGLAEARLHVLGAQLQPHFLFNALNAISAYTEDEPRRARRLMAQLGELLRASLDHAARPEVTLAEELAFLEAYLGIERARFEDRLTVAVRADGAVLDAGVPAFLLQPLVENAIKHGIVRRRAHGRVDVEAWREGDTLRLRVRDDGVGLPGGWSLSRNAGVGLRNAAERLDRLYPGAHRLHVAPRPGGGTAVEVAIPFRAGATRAPPGARPNTPREAAAGVPGGAAAR